MKKFYISTAIIYTNGPPHLGFAFELIQADIIARFHRLEGDETWFLTGTDEHGLSVARASKKANMTPQEFVDQIAGQVVSLTKKLNISNDDFIRTSDKERHWPTPIKLWQILFENNDIYKKKYKGLYCIGHESFIKKTELINGICPIHQTKPEEIEEENWFFKITKYKNDIAKKIESDELHILPSTKKKEILNIIMDAEDISISRPVEVLRWGIPVPNDPSQYMWVWIDALSNYISALGYADNDEKFINFWPADVHLIGKDILRFHALTWPAILMSAGLPLPKNIFVHGFINVDSQKMSKTIGNIIDPFSMIEKYGSDVIRYYLLREIPSDGDGNFSEEKLVARYNGDLANGLGNLVARIVTLIDTKLDKELIYKEDLIDPDLAFQTSEFWNKYRIAIENFRLHDALNSVWKLIAVADKYMNDRKPWKEVDIKAAEFLVTMTNLIMIIHNVSRMLIPFMPLTAEKIMDIIGIKPGIDTLEGYKFHVKRGAPLFPRIQ